MPFRTSNALPPAQSFPGAAIQEVVPWLWQSCAASWQARCGPDHSIYKPLTTGSQSFTSTWGFLTGLGL